MINELRKLNLKHDFKNFYSASGRKAAILQMPKLHYLMFDGAGKPEEPGFAQAANNLYPVAYLLKFIVRERLGIDFGVMPMEVCWRLDRSKTSGEKFTWTMMLLQPDFITKDLFAEALSQAERKVDPTKAALDRVRLADWVEGLCAQILHTGPYEGMNDTFARLKSQVAEQGYTTAADTHDIYLNSILRTRPENLKAIVRVALYPAR